MGAERTPLRWAFVNRDPTLDPDLLHTYIGGWRGHDVGAVLETLTDDCEVVETHGRVYRGRDRVGEMMRNWLAAGGQIREWQITDSGAAGDLLIAEWERTCRWQGEEMPLQGATICRLLGGRISYLREYGGRPAI
jgi:ketosteroid isomerase-like protein